MRDPITRAVLQGMGALGWSEASWLDRVGRGCSDSRKPRSICGVTGDANYLTSCGCVLTGGRAYPCSTSSGNQGSLYCCPQECPTTSGGQAPASSGGSTTATGGKTPSGGVVFGAGIDVPSGTPVSGGATQANIRALQNAILASGCTLPDHGADGIWGSETRAGVTCLGQRYGGLEQVYTQFPFARSLMGGGSSGGGGAVRQEEAPAEVVPEQSALERFFQPSNPYLWLSITGLLTVGGGVAYYLMKRKGSGADSYVDEGPQDIPPTMPPTPRQQIEGKRRAARAKMKAMVR